MKEDQELFAFYGTLRNGQGNWSWALKNRAEYLQTVVIKGFEMFTRGGYPICVPSENKEAKIKVDLFRNKDKESIRQIHGMERGAGYDTTIIKVGGEEYLMYIGSPNHYPMEHLKVNYTQVTSGDWVDYIHTPKQTKIEEEC